jgi:hypothetical protein
MSNRAADWGENAAADAATARIQQLAAMNPANCNLERWNSSLTPS